MKKIEEHNTLVFVVDVKANKYQIKQAIKKLYDVDVLKINTLIRYGQFSLEIMLIVDPMERRRRMSDYLLILMHSILPTRYCLVQSTVNLTCLDWNDLS